MCYGVIFALLFCCAAYPFQVPLLLISNPKDLEIPDPTNRVLVFRIGLERVIISICFFRPKVELLKFTINCWIQFKQQSQKGKLWSLFCMALNSFS